mmetsp:Transcript_289/g.1120  ORF Transcript_289/g.1120 Transcript_289/m.1120 type:complete len:233 (-) Transcript_289:316-1014(-)
MPFAGVRSHWREGAAAPFDFSSSSMMPPSGGNRGTLKCIVAEPRDVSLPRAQHVGRVLDLRDGQLFVVDVFFRPFGLFFRRRVVRCIVTAELTQLPRVNDQQELHRGAQRRVRLYAFEDAERDLVDTPTASADQPFLAKLQHTRRAVEVRRAVRRVERCDDRDEQQPAGNAVAERRRDVVHEQVEHREHEQRKAHEHERPDRGEQQGAEGRSRGVDVAWCFCDSDTTQGHCV